MSKNIKDYSGFDRLRNRDYVQEKSCGDLCVAPDTAFCLDVSNVRVRVGIPD
jgi:hypothetical protein